jgi:nitronate monooxygenase
LYPRIVQGGMGVSVSGWKLAKAVSRAGQLGVVSGTALPVPFAYRLQQGDEGGHLRRAARYFPFAGMAERIVQRYFSPDGKPDDKPFRLCAMPTVEPNSDFTELAVLASFAEVFLAKEGHKGLVGINLLEKIQLPTLPTLFGAMLAGIDFILMGAGIPRSIPGVLDEFTRGEPASIRIDVDGASPADAVFSSFDPRSLPEYRPQTLKRPIFLAIVSSSALATTLARKSNGRVDGFVVEGDSAGGHNAPPRGPMQLSANGEPLYGERDIPDLKKIGDLGLPFWLAGSYGRGGRLQAALDCGAQGIQVGTAFAFCEESGLLPHLKRQAIELSRRRELRIFTDPLASPTDFPFKVVPLPGTLSQREVYVSRKRICDLGYLRRPYVKADGSLGYRCAAEPEEAYVAKGGLRENTRGRMCICNGLAAAVGIGQIRPDGGVEPPLVTAGSAVADVSAFLKPGRDGYSAQDVLDCLLSEG